MRIEGMTLEERAATGGCGTPHLLNRVDIECSAKSASPVVHTLIHHDMRGRWIQDDCHP